MPLSKSSDQLLLEEFIGVEFTSDTDTCMRDAQFFDGAVYWWLMFNEGDGLLFFVAGTQEFPVQSSILEVGIYYAKLEVSPIYGVGDALIITPRQSIVELAPFWLTKRLDGRFSLATSLGSPQTP